MIHLSCTTAVDPAMTVVAARPRAAAPQPARTVGRVTGALPGSVPVLTARASVRGAGP